MQNLTHALRRHWWNEDRPPKAEAMLLLTLVLVAVISTGWGLASATSETLTNAAAALPRGTMTARPTN